MYVIKTLLLDLIAGKPHQ